MSAIIMNSIKCMARSFGTCKALSQMKFAKYNFAVCYKPIK